MDRLEIPEDIHIIHMAHFNPSIDFTGKIGYTSEATILGDYGRTTREQQADAGRTRKTQRICA
jgi:hypothetical protein